MGFIIIVLCNCLLKQQEMKEDLETKSTIILAFMFIVILYFFVWIWIAI